MTIQQIHKVIAYLINVLASASDDTGRHNLNIVIATQLLDFKTVSNPAQTCKQSN